jgi:autotransporter-associated beta strand protein/predicted outer membrane repeat protein
MPKIFLAAAGFTAVSLLGNLTPSVRADGPPGGGPNPLPYTPPATTTTYNVPVNIPIEAPTIADPNSFTSESVGKKGPGTLSLLGDSTYTGGTVIYEGPVIAGSDSAFGASWIPNTAHSDANQQGKVEIAGNVTIITKAERRFTYRFYANMEAGVQSISFVNENDSPLVFQNVKVGGNMGANAEFGAAMSFESKNNPIALTLGNSVSFLNNEDMYLGGAISLSGKGSTLQMGDNATFAENKASVGGAMHTSASDGGNATINIGKSAKFEGNEAAAGGGITAVFFVSMGNEGGSDLGDRAVITLGEGALFSKNKASASGNTNAGGAIRMISTSNSELHINANTLFSENSAASSGGAIGITDEIYKRNSTATIALDTGAEPNAGSIVFKGNTATNSGGAIYSQKNTALAISGIKNVYFATNSDTIWLGEGSSYTQTTTGFVQFTGIHSVKTTGKTGNVIDIQNGTFRIVNNGSFDASGGGAGAVFKIGENAALAGQGTIISPSGGFSIKGNISPDGAVFEAPTFNSAEHKFYTENTQAATGEPAGTLVLNGGNVVFEAGAKYIIDLDDIDSFDQLIAGGTLTIVAGALLEVKVKDPSKIKTEDKFLIAEVVGENTSIVGKFNNGADTVTAGNLEFEISYANNSVTLGGGKMLSSVPGTPEPSTYALWGGVALMGLAFIHRRKKRKP